MSNDIVKAFFEATAVIKPPIYSVSLEAMNKIMELLDERAKRIAALESALSTAIDDMPPITTKDQVIAVLKGKKR